MCRDAFEIFSQNMTLALQRRNVALEERLAAYELPESHKIHQASMDMRHCELVSALKAIVREEIRPVEAERFFITMQIVIGVLTSCFRERFIHDSLQSDCCIDIILGAVDATCQHIREDALDWNSVEE